MNFCGILLLDGFFSNQFPLLRIGDFGFGEPLAQLGFFRLGESAINLQFAYLHIVHPCRDNDWEAVETECQFADARHLGEDAWQGVCFMKIRVGEFPVSFYLIQA